VSVFLCAGRFLALLSSTKESCSNDVSGSRRDHLPKVVGSSRARCEQRAALFKWLETTLDFSHVFQAPSAAKNRSPNWMANWVAASFQVIGGFFHFLVMLRIAR
jgi:hypothetical protein